MADERIEQLAEILVGYSAGVVKGDYVQLITTTPAGLALHKACYRRIIERGAHVFSHIGFQDEREIFLKYAGDEQINLTPEILLAETKLATAYIRITAETNTKALASVPSERITARAKAVKPVFDERLDNTRWVATSYPTDNKAQQAGMSLADYEDFVFGACLLDWHAEAKKMARIADRLEAAKIVRVVGEGTDLTVSIEGRPSVCCDGHMNMPDGEIFHAPVETETQGHILFTFPAGCHGRDVEDIRLEFRDGRVVNASASKNQDLLEKQLATDDGARVIGEFAFGTNYSITKFTHNMLYDEKIGGTMHLALGRGYKESKSRNDSTIHWDIVKDLREQGQVYLDGQLAFENGTWLDG